MRRMHAAGLSGHYIAARMGYRASSAVYRKLALGRPPKPRWTDEENQILVDGYARGWGPARIAERLPGRSPQAVAIAMHRYRRATQQDIRKRAVLWALGVALDKGRTVGQALQAARKADILREVIP